MNGTLKHQVGTPQPSSFDRGGDVSVDAAECPTWAARSALETIDLDSCVPFERLAVRTLRSDYEVVVLPGNAGEVLVRGGRFFSEFRRARLAGSTFGGRAIRVRRIEVGGYLELRVDGQCIVTSTIRALSRVNAEPERLAAM